MDTISWNYVIAFYLFAAGVSAGALIASLIADFSGNKRYERIVKIGAYIAPFPLNIGTFALIFDLERPLSFWRLFTRFEASSVMSIGAWILLLFSFVSLIIFYMHVPDRYDVLNLKPRISNGALSRIIKIGGFILAFATATYTGVLLSVLVARPFWNTSLLPMVFLFSAVIDGIAAIILVMYSLPRHTLPLEDLISSKYFLGKLDLAFLGLLWVSLLFLTAGLYQTTEHANNAVVVIMGGPLTWAFWLGVIVIGMLLPLIYGVYEMLPSPSIPEVKRHKPLLALLVSSSVLIGGSMLRYVVVYAGQITGPILQ